MTVVFVSAVLFVLLQQLNVSAYNAPDEYEHWSEWLIAERDKICYPDKVIKLAGIKPGDSVADIGAGAGYFSFRIGRTVGPQGKCFAVDFSYTGELMECVREKAASTTYSPYNNIYPIKNRYSDINLPDNEIDVAFMYLTGLFLIDPTLVEGDRRYEDLYKSQRMLMESILRALKPGGRFVVVDIIASEKEIMEYDRKHEILCCAAVNTESVKENFESLGLKLVEKYDIYQTKEHLDNIKKFKKSKGYRCLGKSRNFLGREMFFFVFKKPE